MGATQYGVGLGLIFDPATRRTLVQRVAACCSVLQCVAMCCSVLQRVAACCSTEWV